MPGKVTWLDEHSQFAMRQAFDDPDLVGLIVPGNAPLAAWFCEEPIYVILLRRTDKGFPQGYPDSFKVVLFKCGPYGQGEEEYQTFTAAGLPLSLEAYRLTLTEVTADELRRRIEQYLGISQDN